MEWFRLYTRTLDSAKVQNLSLELFKAWVNLCCLARVHDGPLPHSKEIAFRLRVSERKASDYVQSLISLDLIETDSNGLFWMHDWNEHQRVSDNVAERVSRHRAKRACNVTVTPPEQSRAEQIQRQSRTEPEQNESSGAVAPLVAGPTFADFWRVWWNPKAKAEAAKAWPKVAARHGAQFLIDACVADKRRFEHTAAWEWRSNLHPATWLRGSRWEDLPGPAVSGRVNGRRATTAELALQMMIDEAKDEGVL